MKFEDMMILKETWLKIYEMINDQTKDEHLHIWTWIVIWNENTSDVSHEFVTIIKEQPDWQASAAITAYNCWKQRRPVFCWLDQWHEMKHAIHTIQTLDQMKRIWTKNMRTIHND